MHFEVSLYKAYKHEKYLFLLSYNKANIKRKKFDELKLIYKKKQNSIM